MSTNFRQIHQSQLNPNDHKDIEKYIKLDSRQNLLSIKCSQSMSVKSSLTSQNSCGGGDTCPMGFTVFDEFYRDDAS